MQRTTNLLCYLPENISRIKHSKYPCWYCSINYKFYVTCIQSILLYACQVFHHSLLEYLSYSLERLQKRALKIIYGYDISYEQALSLAGLDNLVDRRSQLCDTFFKNIISNPQGSLFNLISDVNDASVHLRHVRPFNLPICKTNRFKKIVY